MRNEENINKATQKEIKNRGEK